MDAAAASRDGRGGGYKPGKGPTTRGRPTRARAKVAAPRGRRRRQGGGVGAPMTPEDARLNSERMPKGQGPQACYGYRARPATCRRPILSCWRVPCIDYQKWVSGARSIRSGLQGFAEQHGGAIVQRGPVVVEASRERGIRRG